MEGCEAFVCRLSRVSFPALFRAVSTHLQSLVRFVQETRCTPSTAASESGPPIPEDRESVGL